MQETKLGHTSVVEVLGEKTGYKNANDFYAAIGYGGIKIGTAFQKLQIFFPDEFPEPEEVIVVKPENLKKRKHSDILVAGHHDIDVHYAKCCNPVPGDKILGYITRGKGISIHRSDCPNVSNITNTAQVVDVQWNKFGVDGSYMAEIKVKAHSRNGLLMDINKVFIDMKIDITAISAWNDKDGFDSVSATLEVKSRRELSLIIKNIMKINSVISVKRV